VVMAMAGIVVGSRLGIGNTVERMVTRFDHPWRRAEAIFAGSVLLLMGALLLGILVSQVGVDTYLRAQYVDSYAAETGKGYLSAGIFLLRMGTLTLLLGALEYRKKLPIVPLMIFAMISMFYLRVGRRGVVLSGLIAVLTILHFYYRPIKLRVLLVTAMAGIALFIAVAHARAYSAGGLEAMIAGLREDFVLEDMWVNIEEVNTVPMAIREMTHYIPDHEPYFYGRSYWEAFEVLIPMELHPNRPLASSQWFAWYHDPRLAAKGGGFAFSLIAEGYINFGYVGAFLVGLIQGAFLKLLVQLRRNNPLSKSRLLIYACVAMQIVFFIRGDFGALLKLAVVIGVPSLALAVFLGRAKPGVAARNWSAA
jgi:hypothetical protein